MLGPSNCDVVVIDDNEDIRDAMELALESLGFSSSSASSAEPGLDLVRRLHPGVVLVDLNMPGKSGRDLVAELRADASLSDIRTVLMSAQYEALDGPGKDALHKPFSLEQLNAVLEPPPGGRGGKP